MTAPDPNVLLDRDTSSLTLASASPRRRALLDLLGCPFSVVVADVDETPRPGEWPDALASRLAQSKAVAVSRRDGSALVLAADTVVALDGVLLGKPADAAEATAMLQTLRGRPHLVYTGLAVATDGVVVAEGVVGTTVRMRGYSDAEIERYVASGRSFDKAGGYGIQDADFRPVEEIDGCYPNVVGLPLCAVIRALADAGLSVDAASGRPTTSACDLCVRAQRRVRELGSTSQRST